MMRCISYFHVSLKMRVKCKFFAWFQPGIFFSRHKSVSNYHPQVYRHYCSSMHVFWEEHFNKKWDREKKCVPRNFTIYICCCYKKCKSCVIALFKQLVECFFVFPTLFQVQILLCNLKKIITFSKLNQCSLHQS